MLWSPIEVINWLYWKAGKYMGDVKELDLSPPQRYTPLSTSGGPLQDGSAGRAPVFAATRFAENSKEPPGSQQSAGVEGSSTNTSTALTNPVRTLNVSENMPIPLKNIKASDYITPQKYLDGAEIPSYYGFQMNLIPPEDLLHGMHTNLEVDRRLTLPTRTHIRFLVTATDVLHSFNVPSLCLKCDALPGRVSRIHTFILREGVFYGQCNEMCGALHGFMPVVIEAVSPEAYAAHARQFYRD